MYYKLEDKIHVYHLTEDEIEKLFEAECSIFATAGLFPTVPKFNKYPFFLNEYSIIINKCSLINFSKNAQEALLYHELGHVKSGHCDIKAELYKNNLRELLKYNKKHYLRLEKEADLYSHNITNNMILLLNEIKEYTLLNYKNSLMRYNHIRSLDSRIKALTTEK